MLGERYTVYVCMHSMYLDPCDANMTSCALNFLYIGNLHLYTCVLGLGFIAAASDTSGQAVMG